MNIKPVKNKFQTAIPTSTLLRKCIAYYYFDESEDHAAPTTFIYYPHYKNAMSIYKQSKIVLNDAYSTTIVPTGVGYSFGFSKLNNRAAQTQIIPPYNKIGVVFQPLGLNHFLEGSLSEYIHAPINVDFNVFKRTMEPILNELFEADNLVDKVAILDDYFLSVYQGFQEHKMEEATRFLFAHDSKHTVEELAAELEISRKTLLRLFNKHQNSSVIDYMKMIQFRRSIELFQNSKDRTKLTELALDTAYYDQSDFIKHFKKLTGFNPKLFFNNLSILGDKGTFWTLS
jgi:AraC-like DNA-binding protein